MMGNMWECRCWGCENASFTVFEAKNMKYCKRESYIGCV